MQQGKTSLADDAQPSSARRERASWYTQGVSDALGDRLLMFDNSDAPSLELLRFREDLAHIPGFEAALRERLQRLDQFRHAAFARVRSVQRLEPDDDLALVSNFTPGKRLSEVLSLTSGPAAAAALVRQLAPALVLLQQHDPGMSHGLLSPDRIIVSPEGRLTIVEHVVGPAVDGLQLGHIQLASMGIALPPSAAGRAPRLDATTDWYQLGLVVVSVLLGRPVAASELPRLGPLLDQLGHSAGSGGSTIPPPLRQWLDRALQISRTPIASTEDGRAALDELLRKDHKRDSHRAQGLRPGKVASATQTVIQSDPGAYLIRDVAEISQRSMTPSQPAADRHGEPRSSRVAAPAVPATSGASTPSGMSTLRRARKETIERAPDRSAVAALSGIRRIRLTTAAVATLGLIAALEAGVIVGQAGIVWSATAPALLIESTASGENVLVDAGGPAATPIQLTVAPDLRWVRVSTASSVRAPGAGNGSTAGVIRISSPIELHVFEDAQLLGAVPGAELHVLPGHHDIELVNEILGYRLRQAVEVEPGQTVSIHVAPPDGWLTIDAAPWAEVSVDGKEAGRTPLARFTLPPGEHDVTFRHPELGSDHQRVTVKSERATRVTGRLRR